MKKVDSEVIMEELVEVAILFDYYGELLSKKQFEMVNEYYNEDLSLTEIAELNSISKQAVSENIKRAIKKLHSFENKLKLVEKNNNINEFLLSINDELKIVNSNINGKENLMISEITEKMDKFLKENAGDNYL